MYRCNFVIGIHGVVTTMMIMYMYYNYSYSLDTYSTASRQSPAVDCLEKSVAIACGRRRRNHQTGFVQ